MEQLIELLKKLKYFEGKKELIGDIDRAISAEPMPVESEITGEPVTYHTEAGEPIVKEYKKQGFDATDLGMVDTLKEAIRVEKNLIKQKEKEDVDIAKVVSDNFDMLSIYEQIGRLKKLIELSRNKNLNEEIQVYVEGMLDALEDDDDLVEQICEELKADDRPISEIIEEFGAKVEEETKKIQLERSAAIGRAQVRFPNEDEYDRVLNNEVEEYYNRHIREENESQQYDEDNPYYNDNYPTR